jgi:hypothetical protein
VKDIDALDKKMNDQKIETRIETVGSNPKFSPEAAAASGEFTAKIVPPPPPTFAMFVQPSVIAKLASQAKIVTNAELEKLRQLQVEYDRVHEFFRVHLRDNAKVEFAKQKQQIALRCRAGEATVENAWTLSDFQNDFETKRKSLKAELRKISAESYPIALEVCRRLGKAAAAIAPEIEAAERKHSDDFGV